jgi:hypothetical protein
MQHNDTELTPLKRDASDYYQRDTSGPSSADHVDQPTQPEEKGFDKRFLNITCVLVAIILAISLMATMTRPGVPGVSPGPSMPSMPQMPNMQAAWSSRYVSQQ